MRVALGLGYRGCSYLGWQSQPGGRTVQDVLESALLQFTGHAVRVACAGRTDAGVHAVQQVVHLDPPVRREPFSWVRGVNAFLPVDVAVSWARDVPADFHAQKSACSRRYRYLLNESAVRPALLQGLVGWTHRTLDIDAMRAAAAHLLGEHDFSAFRASRCQARSPVKIMHSITIARMGQTWVFDFHASAFLHHMVRNIMGCLMAVGSGGREPGWMRVVLDGADRRAAAPTFMPDGLYFVGPCYAEEFALPDPDPRQLLLLA